MCPLSPVWFRKIFGWPASRHSHAAEPGKPAGVISAVQSLKEADMGFGKGALLWLIGIPLPIILLLALFMNR
jgi:hypothetical protein